jgi:hypothetical protein
MPNPIHMEFRQRGQRDDRRRRVLTDEAVAAAPTSSSRAGAPSSGPQRAARPSAAPRYTEAALPVNQPRITDLVPLRYLAQALLIAAALGLAGICVALHVYAANRGGWQSNAEPATVPAFAGESASLDALFDLTSRRSLAAWLTSIGFLGGAGVSLMLYGLRRWRIDDYNGRYRIWLWSAVGCLLMSLDAVTAAGDVVAVVLMRQTGWVGPAGGVLWRLTVGGGAAAVVLARLVWEMRESRPATGLAVLAALLAAVSAGATPGLLAPRAEPWPTLWAALALFAAVSFVGSMSLYARHVLLDAQGLLAAAPRRKRRRSAKTAANATDGTSPQDPSAGNLAKAGAPGEASLTPKSALERASVSRTTSPSGREERPARSEPADEPDALTVEGRQLSKAERRLLRKQRRAKAA